MNAIDILRRLHSHRIWANHQLIACVRSLSRQQLHQPFEIGQGSVWKTLTHMIAAEHVWLEALEGTEDPLMPGDARGQLPGNQNGEDPFDDLDHLLDFWNQLDDRWSHFLDRAEDRSLGDVIYKVRTNSAVGERSGAPRSDILIHVCTHAQYTAAQLTNMLRHLGAEQLPDVMLITLARSESEFS